MKYNNDMRLYLERVERKYEIGLIHGRQGIYRPIALWGTMKLAYNRGYREGQQMKIKAK